MLFPLSLVYGLIVIIRNFLYDKNILASAGFNLPLICIGNLSAGGTGKSPMVEYLLHMLKGRFTVATLSRGYKRKTKGYALAGPATTALDIGDEPMQFHIKFPEVAVAVGEQRIEAVPQLLQDRPDTEAIILDDAFQHRSITAGFNILLTECSNLFTHDWFLPTGDLRDQRSSYKRADVIVVTKCPPEMDPKERHTIEQDIAPLPHQQLFFTTIQYGLPYHITSHQPYPITSQHEVLLVCGIANPAPLKQYLVQHAKTYYQHTYSDHHIFTIDDLNDIKSKLNDIQSNQKIIITTEKDAVRLLKFEKELEGLPLYVIPVKHRFLFDGGTNFEQVVVNYIQNFKSRKQAV